MGNQNSSAFPIEEIRDSETQQQFLYSIDSQNPKNAQPVSPELLDFNKQTNNFVLFTYGEMDFVHYWKCQYIFVAAFTAPKCPIPERSYHFHTFKRMPFITIRCNKNCYQVMNHFMDHAKSSITRTEFLSKVISEIDSQGVKDSHENKINGGFNEAPQIRRASPSKHKKDDNISTSLAPTLTSIKRNIKSNQDNEDHSIEQSTKKRPKVSIQLPTLEDSTRFTNTIEMITYDSVNVSTSFTTADKNNEEEEINNIKKKNKNNKRKPKIKSKNQNKPLPESDDEYDEADEHEMLSENSEEENEEENSQNTPKQKQLRSKNKILTQNKETGSVQSKLDNRNLSFTNGSDAAKSVALGKRKKKITKKSKKPIKSKKKSKKTGKKAPTNIKDNEDNQNQNIQPIDNQIQQNLLTRDINNNINKNNDDANNIDINNSINNNNIKNNNNTISNNNNTKNDNEKFNSKNSQNSTNNRLNTNNNFNSKNSTNSNNISYNKNNNFNNKPNDNSSFNINNNFNSRASNNYNTNNYNSPNTNADDNTNKLINGNKYDDIPNNNNNNIIQPRINRFLNYDSDDIIDSDDETKGQPTNSRPFNENDRITNNFNKFDSKGKQTPSDFSRQQIVGKKSNLSYSDDEEEDDSEKVVKINLKYTNTPNSNTSNLFSKRDPRNRSDSEIEEEEEVNTKSSEYEYESPNKYDSRNKELNQATIPRAIQPQKPAFQISDSTGVSLSKESKEPIKISDPVTHSKLPEDNSLMDKNDDNQIIHFSFSNPLEVSKSEEKNSPYLAANPSNSPKMQVAHLVEISKFDKPKPKIEIGPIVDVSLPETDSSITRRKEPNQQQKLSNQSIRNRSPDLNNNGQKNDEANSDYDYEYFTVLDDKNNNQPLHPQQNEPLVAILTQSPLSKPKRRRHHHHHREIRQIEKEGFDYNDQNDDNRGKKKHRKRKHRHHHRNNNSDSNDYNNDSDSDYNNNNRRNNKHRSPDRHHHRKTQTRKPRNNEYSDDYEDNYNDYDDQRASRKGRRNSPTTEKIDKSIQPTADKSTQLRITPTKTVATSTSFFDKDTKQSQTKESILNRPKEKVIEIEIDYERKRTPKSTNSRSSGKDNNIKNKQNSEEYITNNNYHPDEEKINKKRNNSNRASQVTPYNNNNNNNNNKRPQNENEKKSLDKLPTQNIEKEQPKPAHKVTSNLQNKKYNKNNNEYDDYNYNENEDENENLQPKNNKKAANSTIDSSGWSAALNTISGIENDKPTAPNKASSRFIKNNTAPTNSTISRIDDSTDGSLIQQLLPNNQQSSSDKQPQHTLQKTKIFPLPENKDSSLLEEEELDENNSSSENLINIDIEEEEDSPITGTINDDDEFVVKSKSSRTQSSSSKSSRGSSGKRFDGQIKNIEPIASKSSEVSQFDIFNSDKNKNSSSSSAKKKPNKQICLKRLDRQNNPDSDKFNEFSGSTGTTSSEIGDLENIARGKLVSDSSSSSSRNHRKKISSGLSSEFEAKEKESDFTTNAFEAFSTDSSQNYPSFNEISEKIQQASLVSCDSLKT